MDEISNRTLAILLIGAIVISLGGTFISLNRLSVFMGQQGPTGFATSFDQGYVNLTITSQTSLLFTTDELNFGSGYVSTDSGCNNCTMNSSGWNNTCCRGNWITSPVTTGLVLENVGNQPVSVMMGISKNGSQFLDDTSTGVVNASLWYKVTEASVRGVGDDTSASCSGNWKPDYTVGWNLTRKVSLKNSTYICGDASTYPFLADNTQDEVVIDVQIMVPASATGTGKNVTFNVTGTSSI